MDPLVDNDVLAVNGADTLLTVEDLCGYLVVSKDFIYDEVRQGRLRASRIARQLRFRPADVDGFVEASAVTTCDLSILRRIDILRYQEVRR